MCLCAYVGFNKIFSFNVLLGSGSSGIVLANYSTSFSLLTSSLQDFHECVKGNNNYCYLSIIFTILVILLPITWVFQ